MALALFKALQLHGIDCVIRTESNHTIKKDMPVNKVVSEFLKGEGNHRAYQVPNYHLWIELDGLCMDSDGKRRANHCDEPLNPLLLDKWLGLDCWNDCFADSNRVYGPNLVHAIDAAVNNIVAYSLLDDSEAL